MTTSHMAASSRGVFGRGISPGRSCPTFGSLSSKADTVKPDLRRFFATVEPTFPKPMIPIL